MCLSQGSFAVPSDVAFYAAAIPAVLIAAVSKGGFGSGAGFVAAPLLALVMPPAQAIGLLLPLLMLMDVTGLRSYWRKWDWGHARLLMAGAVPGVLIGWWLFRSISSDGVRLLVGLLAVGFVAFQAARSYGYLMPRPGDPGKGPGLFWGMVMGVTSFVSHAGGPPASMYLLAQRLDKTTYQASTVVVFWWVNLIKLPPYVALHMFTAEAVRANLILAPVAVAGVFLGVWAHKVISHALFFRLTYTLLFVTGLKLIWDALA
jgi:uncharacterized membrane protein YfcA